jgi:hypothetical protein
MLPRSAVHSRKCSKWGNKPGEIHGFKLTRSPFTEEEERKNSLKMNDRSGKVYENKGPVFRSPGRSWNLIENKDGYALKPGILLKTSMLAEGAKGAPASSRATPTRHLGGVIHRVGRARVCSNTWRSWRAAVSQENSLAR